MNSNPYVKISTNGNNAYAMQLPVKTEHNFEGEIWKLPNGQYFFKAGEGAPPRLYPDGIILNGTEIRSSVVNVDIESIVESEVIYKNENGTVAKENWFIYEGDKKMAWDNFSEKNLIIKNVPMIDNIGGYTITDYEKEAIKEKTMNGIFGSLKIEYKIHEGDPLKHTLNFNATKAGIYNLCQEFTDFDFDTIELYDSDSKTHEIRDVSDMISGKINITSLDSKSKDFKQEIKNDPLLLLPETVEFKKDGIMVLGEKTDGAKQDFKSFEYDSTNNMAKFCYGDFVLNAGQSFIVDPDTYISSDPTVDGYAGVANQVGTTCATTGYATATGIASLNVGYLGDSDLSDNCNRGFLEFSISTIPDNSDVTNTVFKFDVKATTSPINIDVNAMQFRPSTSSAITIWNDAGNGTVFVSNTSAFNVVGDNKSLDLGTDADLAVESALTSDWFAFGTKYNSETRDSTSHHVNEIEPEEGVGATPKPTLEITYTPVTNVAFKLQYYNGTAIANAEIRQTNATANVCTQTTNSTGYATCSGLTGIQNATARLTDIDFVVNKTRNFTPATTFTLKLPVIRESCTVTGISNDYEILINQTNSHTITNQTRPVCRTASSILEVSQNVTFSADGKNGASSNSDIRILILNLTAIGKNLVAVYHNGTSLTPTYSNGIITINDLTIGSGTKSFLSKFYFWFDPKPNISTGLSVAVISGTSLNLSWTAGLSGVSSITGYTIYRGTDGTNFPTLVTASTGSATTSYLDSGLSAGTLYYYKIAAINSYGTGDNSTAGSGTTTSSTSSGGSGGSGGGTITNTNSFPQLSITPVTGSLFLGETKSFILGFPYDLTKTTTLKIQSLVLNSGNYDSLSIVPEQISSEGKIVRDGKGEFKVTVQAPENDCSKITNTARCVFLKSYVIQLSVLVHDDKGINHGSYPATLEVSIIDQPKSGTIVILFVIALVVAGGSYGAYEKTRGKTHKTSPKQHKKEYLKALKNAKTPIKKSFLAKLFK